MGRLMKMAGLVALLAIASPVPAAAAVEQESRWVAVEPGAELPPAFTDPEGMTRWEFGDLPTGVRWIRTVKQAADTAGAFESIDRFVQVVPDASRERVYSDRQAGEAAERWLLPHRADDLLAARTSAPIELVERQGRDTSRLWIQTRRVGIGWLFLPSGPREVVLQRALVLRQGPGRRGLAPESLVHRWIDPRFGVVASVWGPVSSDGKTRLAVAGGELLEEVLQGSGGGSLLKIYADELDHPLYERLAYGFDRGAVAVSALTPEAYTTIGALVAASSWDFSSTNQGNSVSEIASTSVPINADETCSFENCGFDIPGAKLGREDRDFDLAEPNIILSSVEREERANDVTLWLRAAVKDEGEVGGLGEGESRLCFVSEGGETRTEVPLYRFSHEDADGFYMQDGDDWSHTPFNCEQNIFNAVCPNCGLFCEISIQGCDDYSGRQFNDVIAEGPVTLPSGHTFNSLVIRNVSEFCAYLGGNCVLPVSTVRTVIHLWMVPKLGTVARLMSEQDAPDLTSFTTLAETDLKFGLFPPRSMNVDNAADSTLQISWDPGLDTHRIDGYKVYWDTDSGADSAYAFNSVDNAGQITIGGTSATISGLAEGTEYFVTVTSLSDFTDPSSGVTTSYESLVYPSTVSANPEPVPVELSAMTTGGSCTPTTTVRGLTVAKTAGPEIELCWNPAPDECLDGYQLLGATDPSSAGNFAVAVADTGLNNCHTFDTSDGYFLVVIKGSGGTGPWGHFGM